MERIEFTPARIIEAFAYHIIDERFAKTISRHSFSRARNRMARENFSTSINKIEWKWMSGYDKLIWLSLNTPCKFIVDREQRATLSIPAPEKPTDPGESANRLKNRGLLD